MDHFIQIGASLLKIANQSAMGKHVHLIVHTTKLEKTLEGFERH
jgi:hypothetical protein